MLRKQRNNSARKVPRQAHATNSPSDNVDTPPAHFHSLARVVLGRLSGHRRCEVRRLVLADELVRNPRAMQHIERLLTCVGAARRLLRKPYDANPLRHNRMDAMGIASYTSDRCHDRQQPICDLFRRCAQVNRSKAHRVPLQLNPFIPVPLDRRVEQQAG